MPPKAPFVVPLTAEQQELALTCLPACYRYAGEYSQSRDDYEDYVSLAQLTLTKAAKAFNPLRGVKFSTYVINAINKELYRERDRRMTQSRSRYTISLDSLEKDKSTIFAQRDDTLRVDDQDEQRTRLRQARRAISRLPQRDREIVRLRLSGVTLREIGERYGISNERVRQVYEAGLRRVRRSCGVWE
jgi:RNA polymerase sigma factor (sigma-70 family)